MNTMNIASSPNCVSGFFQYVDSMVLSPSPSSDSNDDESSVHQLLVERWFRERFFLPRPYRSTSIVYDDEDAAHNDIIDDGSFERSMALFSDNLVSKEIRSNIVPLSNDGGGGDCCSLRHRYRKSRPPLGVVMVVDNGAPLIPLARDHNDGEERMEAASKSDSSEEQKEGDDACHNYPSCQPDMGFIQRTFSFDEQLPVIHRKRAASIKALHKCMEEDDDYYIEDAHQPTFTVPVTYSNGGNRSKVVYPIQVPASP